MTNSFRSGSSTEFISEMRAVQVSFGFLSGRAYGCRLWSCAARAHQDSATGEAYCFISTVPKMSKRISCCILMHVVALGFQDNSSRLIRTVSFIHRDSIDYVALVKTSILRNASSHFITITSVAPPACGLRFLQAGSVSRWFYFASHVQNKTCLRTLKTTP